MPEATSSPHLFSAWANIFPFYNRLSLKESLIKPPKIRVPRTPELLCPQWISKILAGWLSGSGKSSLGGQGLESVCAEEAWTADKWEGTFQICNFQVSEGYCTAPLTLSILGGFSPFFINTSAVGGVAFAPTWSGTHSWERELQVSAFPPSHIWKTRQTLFFNYPRCQHNTFKGIHAIQQALWMVVLQDAGESETHNLVCPLKRQII